MSDEIYSTVCDCEIQILERTIKCLSINFCIYNFYQHSNKSNENLQIREIKKNIYYKTKLMIKY